MEEIIKFPLYLHGDRKLPDVSFAPKPLYLKSPPMWGTIGWPCSLHEPHKEPPAHIHK